MSKGQIANQVFVYVLAAIVFSMVLIYGYNAINNFAEDARYVTLIQLKSNLESSINEVASTQNVKIKSFTIPAGFKEICFFDSSKPQSNPSYGSYWIDCTGSSPVYPGVVCDAWKSNTTINGFLSPMGSVSFKTVRVQLKDSSGRIAPIDCYDVSQGQLKLRFQGMGDRTQIEEVVG
jgi:hypothetical protein